MIQYIECAFINTDQKPISSQVEGYCVLEDIEGIPISGEEKALVLYEFVTEQYKNPCAPEYGTIYVLKMKRKLVAKKGSNEYPALYLLREAQRNVSNANRCITT
jgi:hypothetical protein